MRHGWNGRRGRSGTTLGSGLFGDQSQWIIYSAIKVNGQPAGSKKNSEAEGLGCSENVEIISLFIMIV